MCYFLPLDCTVHSPLIFRKIVEIEHFALPVAIWVSMPRKAARTDKRSILTILRKNIGLWTVYYATKQNKKKASFDCPIDSPLAIVNSYGKLLFSNLYSAGNLLRVQLAKPKFLYSCSFVVLLLFMRNHFQVNPFPLHNFVPMVLTFNIPVFQYMLVMFPYAFCYVTAFTWLLSSLLIALL